MKINEILVESSLSRIYAATQKHDFGTITAFRSAYSFQQNQQRNKSLLAKLKVAGFSVTSIKGSYIENYGLENAVEVSENSFIVVDVQDKGNLRSVLLKLGEEFDQDSIIYGNAGDVGTLIGTNETGYPGYHKEVPQGGALFGQTGQFMSRVNGRPFIFAESIELTEHGFAKYPSELRGPHWISQKHWSELGTDSEYTTR